MKKYLFLIVVLTYSIIAQDKEPGQHKFNFLGIEQYLSADSAYFKQEKFILGYQWGCSRKITQATFCNQTDITHKFIYSDYFSNNTYVILKPSEYSHAVGGEDLNARGIEYSPVAKIDPNEPEKLVKRAGDTTRRCFGYKYIRGKISNNPTDSFYNSLVVGGDSLVNQVILAEPWPSNQLTQFGSKYQTDSLGQIIMNSHLCQTLYFNINLRRINSNSMSDENVLKIELPHSYLYDSVYIKYDTINQIIDTTELHFDITRYSNIQFDSLTINSSYPSDTNNLTSSRGCYKNLFELDTSGNRAFYITKRMIPSDTSNKYIPLSASFRCNGNWRRHNFKLKSSANPKFDEIDSIKIKITYLGGCTIAINNTSITTPHTRKFLSGYYDNQLDSHVQQDLNRFDSVQYKNKNVKLFRYNTIVEGGLQNWIAEKYFNKLIGNISCSETGIFFPAHYEYYVNAPSRWFGVLLPLIKYL